jgi:DNA (cytosine-5)-methyltransferase 1
MNKPRCLDLFCGAGGATKGLQNAGFHVTGIDNVRQPRYCGDAFIQADALKPPVRLSDFDFIWASPPCQRYSVAQNAAKNAAAHPDLVADVRQMLIASGSPWVMENVVGAPLINPVMLCGLAFGLKVKRHRLLESSALLLTPPCPPHEQEYYVIFGHEARIRKRREAGRKNCIGEGRRAMGIDWMSRGELSLAIPPAYSEFIGRQFLAGCREFSGGTTARGLKV